MITHLSLKNFKGANADYEFGRGTLITGKNFSGKSAIDQAIRCLVLGYVPGIAKTGAGLKMFASGFPMAIKARISDHAFAVGFDAKGKQAAFEAMPASPQTRVLFDPDIFFGLSDAARISKACELVQSADGNFEDLRKVVFELVKGHELLTKFATDWASTMTASPFTINEILASSETFWKEVKKRQNEEKVRMQKLIEGMSDMSTVEEEAAKLPPRHEAEAMKARLQQEISKLDGELAQIDHNVRTFNERRARREKYAALVATIPALEKSVSEVEPAVAELEKELEALNKAANEAYAAQRAAIEESQKAAPQQEATSERRTDEFTTGAVVGKRFSANVVLRLTEDDKIEVEEVIDWAEIITRSADAEEAEMARAYNEEQHRDELNQKAMTATEQVVAARDRLSNSRWTLMGAQKQLAIAKNAAEELANIPSGPELMDVNAVEALRQERKIKAASLAEADTTIQNIVRLEQDLKRIKEAAVKRTTVEATVKLAGEVLEVITQKKQEIVSLSIDAPLAIANKLANGILKGPLVMEGGEIGMRVDNQFISARVFSGTESAIVMMGLTAGLAHRSELRLLLLDEIGRLDVSNAIRLTLNLAEMVKAGDIDQFILIGPANEVLLDGLHGVGLEEPELKHISV